MAVKRKPKPLLIIIIIMVVIFILVFGSVFYLSSPVNRKSEAIIEVVIEKGTGTKEIAKILKEKKLIKSELVFLVYTKFNGNKSLKAATYELKKSMNLEEIINLLSEGSKYNPDEVKITFKEGLRITDYAEEIAQNTNNTYEQVINTINNKDYLRTLINKYWFLTEDILTEGIYYPLEGYLAPDTYHLKNKEATVEEIIEKMLEQMEKNLEPFKMTLINNPHRYMTMASIVELEGTNLENKKMIVGIFNNRINKNMNLGSDVTTYYALQYPMTSDLTTEQFATINPYNTRASNMGGKLPLGPICNMSMESIEASLNPTASTYLFFVADKNGNVYYTNTVGEHEAKIKEIKDKGDWIW